MKAREAYSAEGREVDYRDVKADRSLLDEMLRHSKGRRDVPVILDGGKVTIGYGGS